MALTKVITGVTDLNQAQSTNGLKFPTGDAFAGTPEEGMIRNDQSQASEGSASTMQFYNGTAWKNFVNKVPIPLGSDNFNTVLYTGNGTTQNVGGVGFQPDFTWIKNRNNSANSSHAHALFDSVRTSGFRLVSNTTAAQNNYSSYMTGFNSDGFGVSGNQLNDSASGSYVAWNWKAGGTAVSNTDGSITSSVSANTAAGFSIVKWSGNDLASQTIGHGLSSTPELYIIKKTSATLGWQVNLSSLVTGTEGYLLLDRDLSMYTTFPNYYTSANSSVLSTNGTSTAERLYNNQSAEYIAYCFHSVAGYQKIGSYIGSGTTSKVVSGLGFTPSFVMIKRTDSSGVWVMLDNKRVGSYPNSLYANSSAAEDVTQNNSGWYPISFSSGQFELLQPTGDYNAGGTSNYIYMAFA